MSRKKKSNDDIIAEYYDKKRISASVRKIKLDNDRYNKAMLDINNSAYVDSIYEKFDIHRYTNKHEFFMHKLETMPNIPTEKLNEMWSDYQHRDKLIISGQYEEWRYKAYRDNYIEAMKRSAFPTNVIKNIEKLSLEEWKNLVILPKSNKENVGDTLLPKLGGFHYGDAASKYVKAATDEIKEAFKAANINYVDTEDISKRAKTAITEAKSLDIKDTIEVATKIDNVLRLLHKVDKEQLLHKAYTDISEEIVDIGSNIPASRIKTSKSGNRYIPFVGSTKEGTANEKFVKALLKGFDIYK